MSQQKKQRKQQQQIRQRQERQKQLIQEHKDTMMPLVKFLKKEGLPFRYARIGQNRVQYFRYDDLEKLKNEDGVKAKLAKNEKVANLLQSLQKENNLIFYRRPSDMKALKYPSVLQYIQPGHPEARFCSFKFDTTVSRKGLMFGIVAGVLAVVLFPVWPFSVKYAIWLVSLYLLVFLVGLLLFRLVVYLLCVVLGYNVWILPNLLGDYGFIDSFRPLIYAERWQRSTINIIIRVSAFALIVFYGVQLYLDPTFLQSHFTTTTSTINDIHDWGVSKIKNERNFSEKAITNLEKILNETKDVADDQVGEHGANVGSNGGAEKEEEGTEDDEQYTQSEEEKQFKDAEKDDIQENEDNINTSQL